MSTMTLEAMQNELMREILNIDDLHLLEKIKKMIHRNDQKAESATPNVVSEDAAPYMSKAEILEGLAEACKELKQNLEGKLEFKPAEELLNEL